MKREMYIALYAPSSVQKLLDFLKTIYSVENTVPVIIKPFGAAAQVGVPEAHRLSYKLGKPLIILPELRDLRSILNCESIYYLGEEGVEVELDSVLSEAIGRKTALVVNSGEQEPSRKELEDVKVIWPIDIPRGISATALAGVIAYKLYHALREK
jgi:SpoU rRNA methylase family enzyme